MIDLDQPARYPTGPNGTPGRRWPRRATGRTLALVVVVAFLAGGILGGVAMHLWRYQPLAASVAAQRSTVSVLLFAESGLMTVRHEQRRARLEAQVTIVNAGPETVTVLAVRVDQPAVTVRSPERARFVAPGTALPVDVVVEWNCGADQSRALVASVRVETADEHVRTISPVALDDTPWAESRRTGCAEGRPAG
ncbi:hypothetical protein Ani05nite_59410 [Amorphoplanes nipponensis]|uniref:Uncharacterized protein n=1 Tax=Actinoplanes nipponensis TaxID=135950 RepID=A0A919JND5_9ACTN|nr:hypothetical protein [Actinoplanes nipponensis]GIE52407.1 hypothetical protein Ani05nite_59410 [Actinoplanes nipponensis]